MLSESPHAVEPGTGGVGGWLHARRIRISAWIAAAECIVVLFSPELTKFTVVALGVLAVLLYAVGRESGSHLLRQILWIFAASQLLAVLGVILAWIVKWAVILAVIVFAVVGLLFLLRDRR